MLNKIHLITLVLIGSAIVLVFVGLLFFSAKDKVPTSTDVPTELEQVNAPAELEKASTPADAPTELEQAKSNILSTIREGNFAEAEAQTQKLLANSSGRKDAPQAVYDIAYRYHEVDRDDKALEFHQYNVEHFPNDIYAIDSQAEIVYYYIVNGNDAAADAAFDKLLTVFAQHEALPKKISQVAVMYNNFNKPDKALTLHKYNIEHFPDSMYAMWSQVEIVYSHIRKGEDAAADEACDKLVTAYSKQPTLPKEVYQIANAFRKAGRYDKAKQLYQYVVDNPCGSEQRIWKKASEVRLNIALGNEAEVRAALNGLIANFSSHPEFLGIIISLADEPYDEIQTALNGLIADVKDHPDLPMAILIAGEQYYKEGLAKENAGLEDQAKDRFQKAVKIWDCLINHLKDSPLVPPNLIPEVCCYAGDCYLKLGKYQESIRCFQKVVDNYPKYKYAGYAQSMVGRCFEEMKSADAVEKNP
ncbi:MAG: tetratricopeptide repeat protein [Sedimentisphaerales bacterium]